MLSHQSSKVLALGRVVLIFTLVQVKLIGVLENPGSDDPLDQVELTPEAKISLTLLPNIKMTPVDVMSAGDFICIFEFRFGRRGI